MIHKFHGNILRYSRLSGMDCSNGFQESYRCTCPFKQITSCSIAFTPTGYADPQRAPCVWTPAHGSVFRQKFNLSANCIKRGSPERVVILPKAELLKLRSGSPNCGVLNALNISQRSSRLRPSPKNPNVRANAKSKFVKPGPRRVLRQQVTNRFCGSG